MKTVRKIFRYIISITSSIIVILFLSLYLAFKAPAVQQFFIEKARQKVEKQSNITFLLGSLRFLPPGEFVFKDLQLLTSQKDTILITETLSLHIGLRHLLQKRIQLNELNINSSVIHITKIDKEGTTNIAFSNNNKKKKDSSQSAWTFNIEKLRINQLDFRYTDKVLENKYRARVGSLAIDMEQMDLKHNYFAIKHGAIANSSFYLLTNNRSLDTRDTSGKTPPEIQLIEKLKLENIRVDIANKPEAQNLAIDNLHLTLINSKVNLAKSELSLETLALRQTVVHYSDTDSLSSKKEMAEQKDRRPFNWHIVVNDLIMEENQLTFLSPKLEELSGYLQNSPSLDVSHISARLKNWTLNSQQIKGEINHLSFAEQKGFWLKNLQSKIMLDSDTTIIKHLQLNTNHSKLLVKASSQGLLNRTSNNLSNNLFQLEILPSYLGTEDVAHIYDLSKTFNDSLAQKNVHFEGYWEGSLNKLAMPRFRVSIPGITKMHLQGKVNNLLNKEITQGTLLFDTLWVNGHKAKTLVNDTIFPDQLQVPEYAMLQMEAEGDFTEIKMNTHVTSNLGRLNLSGTFRQDILTEKQSYQVNWEIINGNLAGLSSSGSSIGAVSLNGELTAQSEAFSNFRGDSKMNVDTLVYNGYTYSGIELSANLGEAFLSGDFSVSDPNLALELSARLARTLQASESHIRLGVSKAHLAALGFSREELRVSTHFDANFQGRNIEQITGNAKLNSTTIISKGRRYMVDSIALKLTQAQDYQLVLSSPFIQADFRGEEHPGILVKKFSKYGKKALFSSKADSASSFPEETFDLHIAIEPHPILSTLLLPELNSFGGGQLDAQRQKNRSKIAASGKIWGIRGSSIELDTAGFRIALDTTKKEGALYIRNFNSKQLSIPHLESRFQQNGTNGEAIFFLKDKKAKEKYYLRANLAYKNKHWEAKILPDKLLLNYQDWQLPENNKLNVHAHKLVWQDMIFSHKNQKIAFEHKDDSLDVLITFEQFNLSTFSALVSANNIVQGSLNGNINLSSAAVNTIKTNLTINNLRLLNHKVFQAGEVSASNVPEESAKVEGKLIQEKGNLLMQGHYTYKTNEVELLAEINSFDISSLQPFLVKQIENLTGTIDGQVNLKKSDVRTELNGEMQFRSIKFSPIAAGTGFKIPNSSIKVINNQLVLNNFTIVDANDNRLDVSGQVKQLFADQPLLALNMQTRNFQWLNKSETSSLPYYGKLNANLTAQINGALWQPTIEAEARLNGSSDLIYLLPNTQEVTIEQKDIVSFKSEYMGAGDSSKSDSLKKTVSNATFDPALTARLEVDKQAKLTLMIDPASNERLEVQGTAALNFQKSRSGQLSLTGQYRISEGIYSTNLYQLIRRDFAIESGSSLTWTGAPASPSADMTATYRVRTSPSALVSNEITQMSKDKQKQLARSIPFLVRLHIQESLLAPEIKFDIKLAPETQAREVEAKLAQINKNESEVNKQALSLLLLGTFSETSMSSNHPMAYEIGAKARTGLSSLLSNQLNKLAAEYVKGVDVNVDVTSYSDRVAEKTEANTQVQLDLEKRFFNDRLSVQVGGKMNLEDPTPENTSFNSLAGNVVMLYDLTPDGRFKLKGFSTTEYENYLEGEITKTGIGIIFNRDYKNLGAMFSLPADTSKMNQPTDE